MAQESWKIEKDESNCEILKPPSSSSSSPSSSSSLPSSSSPPPPPSASSSSPSPPSSSSSTAAAAAVVATTITAAATIPLLLKPPHEFPIQRSEMGEAPDTGDSGAIVSVIRKLDDASPRPVRFANRCSSCQKRVGLTGFRCRCGDLFCSQHRYSDTHDCSFDYKAAGREAISKANPVIRAAKIIRI